MQVACLEQCTNFMPVTNLDWVVHTLLNHMKTRESEQLLEKWRYGRKQLEWILKQYPPADVKRAFEL